VIDAELDREYHGLISYNRNRKRPVPFDAKLPFKSDKIGGESQ
jgi:hypothetical protein